MLSNPRTLQRAVREASAPRCGRAIHQLAGEAQITDVGGLDRFEEPTLCTTLRAPTLLRKRHSRAS
jgi:hypothetical protein